MLSGGGGGGGGGKGRSEAERIRDARAASTSASSGRGQPPPIPKAAKKELVWPPVLPGPARPGRRVVRTSQAFLDYERARKSEKPLVRVDDAGAPLVKVLLKSKPDAAANVAGLMGGDAKEDGLPLAMFSKSIRLWLSHATMQKCPFFKKMLTKKWKGKGEVQLELAGPDLVDAFEAVLHVLQIPDYSIHEDINSSNQFKIYHAANFLGFYSIQEQCEAFIKLNMDEQVFLAAVEEAKVMKDVNLLDTCYTYFKRVGLKPLLLKKGSSKNLLERKRSSDDILQGGGGKYNKKEAGVAEDQSSVSVSELLYDQKTRELSHGKKRVKIDSFKKILQQEIGRKEKFYTVGTFTDEYDDLVEDIDDDEEGYENMVQCYMKREKVEDSKTGKSMQYFSVYHEDDDSFIIAARLVEGTSKFIISMNRDDFEPFGHNYLGECSSNFLGTHFSVYDFGMNITRRSNNPLNLMRVEHGLVHYASNVLGRVPNKMKVILPRDQDAHKHDVDQEGPDTFKKEMLTQLHKKNKKKEFYLLNTKGPVWSKELDAWTMDFRGRVKMASKKNFQLECPDILYTNTLQPMVLMVFGKITKNRFAFDLRAPLTIVQALGVALSAFADKLIVT